MNADELWAALNGAAHPEERPLPTEWKDYYWPLFRIIRRLPVQRICEIGVRAGYSAFTMFQARPDASVLGIEADLEQATENTHGGRKGYYEHALEILAPFDFQVMIVNSHAIQRLPSFDLIYVDGEHTYDGCLQDLQLAARSTDLILVDDYHSIPAVQTACDTFLTEQNDFRLDGVESSLSGIARLKRI